MTRADAVVEVIRCARLVSETGGADEYFVLELRIAIEDLDRASAEVPRTEPAGGDE
jgi:hypothetical protein